MTVVQCGLRVSHELCCTSDVIISLLKRLVGAIETLLDNGRAMSLLCIPKSTLMALSTPVLVVVVVGILLINAQFV